MENQIFNESCLDTMSRMEDNSIDLIVTSPPYDNLRAYDSGVDQTWGESVWKPIISELCRVIKEGGAIVWVVGDATINGSETGTSFKQALYFKECGLNLHDTMIWEKANPIPQIYRKRYTNLFEYMFVFSKGTLTTHNPIRIPCENAGLSLKGTTYKNFSKSEQIRSKKASPVKEDKLKGNIWKFVVGKKKEDQESKGHTAPFPCDLAHDHIISWSNEGDIVYDPFLGSGTTAKMAKTTHRKYIGSEINEDYFKIAQKRLSQTQEYLF